MEIKIVATENEENQLNELVDYLQKCGLKVIRQAGGNMPNFIGYFASISGKYSERQSSTEISKQPDSKALHKADVSNRRELFDKFYNWLDNISEEEYDDMSLTDKCEKFFFKT